MPDTALQRGGCDSEKDRGDRCCQHRRQSTAAGRRGKGLRGGLPGGDASVEQRAGLKATEQRIHLRLGYSSLIKTQSLIQEAYSGTL